MWSPSLLRRNHDPPEATDPSARRATFPESQLVPAPASTLSLRLHGGPRATTSWPQLPAAPARRDPAQRPSHTKPNGAVRHRRSDAPACVPSTSAAAASAATWVTAADPNRCRNRPDPGVRKAGPCRRPGRLGTENLRAERGSSGRTTDNRRTCRPARTGPGTAGDSADKPRGFPAVARRPPAPRSPLPVPVSLLAVLPARTTKAVVRTVAAGNSNT